ncbi:MAG: hypothetical protein KDC44_10485, partial [Phaeodactylibacter sp.]|nr:hypothetical protein [Phaeodactylibacter sp.]
MKSMLRHTLTGLYSLLFVLGTFLQAGAAPVLDCFVEDIVVQPFSCDGSGTYLVQLDFNFGDQNSDSFQVTGNGHNYGSFAYADLPVTVGPFFGDGLSGYELVVTDAANPDCANFIEFEAQDCSSFCIDFEEFAEGDLFGADSGLSSGDLAFTTMGVPVSVASFTTTGGDVLFNNLTFFQDWFGPLEPLAGTGAWPSNISMSLDFSGLDYPVQALRFGFVQAGPQVNLALNGQDPVIVGSVDDLPAAIAPGVSLTVVPTATGSQYNGYILLEGEISSLLIGGQELGVDNVCLFLEGYLPTCSISNLSLSQTPCNSEGEFYVDLDFDYENVGNFGFEVGGNGNNYGTFDYADLPVQIGPLSGDGSVNYVFKVRDVELNSCQAQESLGAVNCSDQCLQFEDLEAGTVYSENTGYSVGDQIYEEDGVIVSLKGFVEANGVNAFGAVEIQDGLFPGSPISGLAPFFLSAGLEFDFSGLGEQVTAVTFSFAGGSANFGLNGNGIHYLSMGFIELMDLTIPGFDISVNMTTNNSGSVTIVGPVNQLVLGGLTAAVDNICFVTSSCSITDFTAELIEEVSDAGLIEIDFTTNVDPETHFTVTFNGEWIATYQVGDLPVQPIIPCYLTNPNHGGVLEVCLDNAQTCCAEQYIDLLFCADACILSELVLEPQPCTPNGIFYVDIDFNHANTGDLFKVFGNGVVYGEFAYADLPISVGPFVGDGTTIYELAIQDLQFGDCGLVGTVGPVDCNNNNCTITDLSAELIEDTQAGAWFLLDFNYTAPG